MLFRLFCIYSILMIWPFQSAWASPVSGNTEQFGATEVSSQTLSSFPLKTVKIGVLAFRGKAQTLEHWTATADYLTESVSGYQFVIIPLALEEMEDAVRDKKLDFAITNSGHYITLAARYGGSRLVTMNARGPSSQENLTGSVIITRADSRDIFKLDDLRGKTFMSVAPQAFCFQTAKYRMQEQGLDPKKDFKKLLFVGFPQDYIATAVKRGIIDAGNIRTGVLEAMAAEGKIKLSDFRILAPKKLDGFPYVSSTKVYPEWPFIKLKETDKALSQKVAIALLSMAHDSKPALKGHYAGWTVPLDYSSVHNLFRALKAGPYAGLGELTLASFFAKYKEWMLLAAALLLISWLWVARTERVVARRTGELARANEALGDEMTERRRVQEVARQRQSELSRVAEMNSMGELASGIAHELNHPLATITNYAKGCIRKMRSGNESKEELLDILQRVSDQADRASQIISGLRDSMRDDKNTRVKSDINKIIHEMSDLLEFDLMNSQTELQLDLSKQVSFVYIDPIQIEQVLINLVRNAIDAIEAANPAERRIRITTTSDEDAKLLVCVADTGQGVDETVRTKIFDPFVSTKQEGMGLGLSISCSIIKDHGGLMWIGSTGEQGAKFCFNLPAGDQNGE